MKKPEIINTRGLKGDIHLITWGRVREKKETLTLQLHRSLFLAMRCLRKNYLSWLPCVHHLKYCNLLCMELNRNICFSYLRHWWIKKDLRKLYIYTLWQVVLLLFFWGGGGGRRESGAEKNNPSHSLCTVYGLCRLMQIFWNETFRRDHTTKARVKKLAFLVCYRCIVNFTVILIANISKYRLYIYLYIVFHKA